MVSQLDSVATNCPSLSSRKSNRSAPPSVSGARSLATFIQDTFELLDLMRQLAEFAHHLGFAWGGSRGCVFASAVKEALGQGAGQQRDEAYASGHHNGGHYASQDRRGVDVAVGHGGHRSEEHTSE